MRAGRLILVVATLVTILVFPLLMHDALNAFKLPNAYASIAATDHGGRYYANGNNGGDENDNANNNNGNHNNNNSSDDNDNVECFNNLNDNDVVPCDFNNNNGNSNNNNGKHNDHGSAPPPPPSEASGSSLSSRRCFSVQESGYVRLNLAGGSIDIHVVPAAPLPQDTSIRLNAVDPATVPAPSGGATFLDTLVWQMQASVPCDGSSVSTLPGAVNLGIPYTVSANKSKLQIVMLSNGAWVDVQTTPDPDPNNPFISATVQQTGTYAVVQKP